MKYEKKFIRQEQQHVSETQSSKTAAQEFSSAEEMLRYDAKQTTVPPEIAQRLNQSLQKEPGRRRPWWQWWLG